MPDQPSPLPLGRHGGKARDARSARQGQQQGFDLVIGVLCDCYGLNSTQGMIFQRYCRQSLVSGLPGSILGALAGRGARIQPLHAQRHTQLAAQGHAMLLKAVGSRL